MYVKRIVLVNIRGFRHLDFSLQRPDKSYAGWTVFTGDNGSGKSALLKSTSIALVGMSAARPLQSSFAGWVRSGESEGIIALELVPSAVDDIYQESGKTTSNPFWAEIRLRQSDTREPILERSYEYTKKGKTASRGPWADAPVGWFACGYGPFRRIYGHSSDAQRLMAGGGAAARFVTMFREDASLAECDRWLRDLQFRSIEGKTEASETLKVVKEILDDELLQNGFKIERIDSDGLWLRDQAGTILPLADMSDGYRAALALMTDILRHLIDAYRLPNLTEKRGGTNVIGRSGVILIDEIDAHLHPEWQRVIGFWLKRHMPNMQFLVTSHSPLVCQSADRNGIFHLPEPGSGKDPLRISDDDYDRIIASKPDTILLTPAFDLTDTRSPRAVEKRETYARLRAKKAAGVRLTSTEEQDLQLCFAFLKADPEFGLPE